MKLFLTLVAATMMTCAGCARNSAIASPIGAWNGDVGGVIDELTQVFAKSGDSVLENGSPPGNGTKSAQTQADIDLVRSFRDDLRDKDLHFSTVLTLNANSRFTLASAYQLFGPLESRSSEGTWLAQGNQIVLSGDAGTIVPPLPWGRTVPEYYKASHWTATLQLENGLLTQTSGTIAIADVWAHDMTFRRQVSSVKQ